MTQAYFVWRKKSAFNTNKIKFSLLREISTTTVKNHAHVSCLPCTLDVGLFENMSVQGGPMRCLAARFTPGQELRESLLSWVKSSQLKAAFIITCVGSVKKATLRMADSVTILTFDGPFEIVSLVGTLSGGHGHLHISLSDRAGHVIGGHVVGDLFLHTTAEVVLGEMLGARFEREKDEHTGYDELVVYQDQEQK